MQIQCFRFNQTIPFPLPEVWRFFSDAANLSMLTPPEAAFEAGEIDGPVYPGQILTHRVRVLPGLAAAANGKPVDQASIARHAAEVDDFAKRVKGDDVAFSRLRWSDLVAQWAALPALAPHAAALQDRFGPF